MNRYLKAIQKRSHNICDRFRHVYQILFAPHQGTLHRYNQESPHPQQMINLFEHEWMSQFPHPYQDLKAGIYPLFEDGRLAWAIQQLGGVKNKTVLELGPLEGGHSYMLQQQGADSVVAVEANPRAYLRCLLVKELMKLNRVNFLFGDFNEYLRKNASHFDVCIASGVLYHMKNPMELIALISQKCSSLFLWTQYYDPLICSKPNLRSKFLSPAVTEYQGFKHRTIPFQYGASRSWSTFIGGPARTSCWLPRQDILDGLRHFGFRQIQVHSEELEGLHGPSFSLIAQKS